MIYNLHVQYMEFFFISVGTSVGTSVGSEDIISFLLFDSDNHSSGSN